MKFYNLTLALALAGLLTACDQTPQDTQNGKQMSITATTVSDDSPVLATVNGTPITESVLKLYQQQRQTRRPNDPSSGNRHAVLEEIINLELARQDGEKQGVANDSEIQLQIAQQRRAVIATAAIQNQLEKNPITDEDLQKLYEEQVPRGDEYKARHILVKEEEEAKKLITELDKGADFSELAKQHSTGPSGKNGGDLGWFSPNQMVKPFSDAVAVLEKGGYSKTPVKTQFGWHIIVLDDSRAMTPPPFDQVKPQLQAFVQNQRVQEYITALRSGATIEMEMKEPVTTEPEAATAKPEDAPEPAAAEPADAAAGESK